MSGGLRFDESKPRPDLIPGQVQLGVGRVLEFGARKYAEHNWEMGMPWSKVIASLERHIAKLKAGEDIDDESDLPHVDHIACNAVFLAQYYRSHSEQDDRFIPWIMNHKRIALDIDGVLADFSTAYSKRIGLEGRGNPSWYMSYSARKSENWKSVFADKEFWMNLSPLIEADSLAFEPVAYVTSRGIPQEWTEEWLEMNGFPCNEVVTVEAEGGEHGSKVDELKKRNIDIFIDDHFKHFIEVNQAGIKCYLQDTYYNKRYDVGAFRIFHPNDVLKFGPYEV